MHELDPAIKLTYFALIGVFVIFVIFIILFVIIYKNKQTNLYNKNQMNEALLKQQQLEAEIEKMNALQSERDRISIDMHDDLGSGLSSIKLISELLKKKHKDEETQNDLNQIVEYATELTSTMREMVWSLNPRNDRLDKFIYYVQQYAHQFFEPSGIQLHIDIPSDIPETTLNGFVRRNLFLCIKEIFNNIIKHSEANKVRVTLQLNNNEIHISIQDNGKGISAESKINNGLYNIKKRITDCGGIIEWNNLMEGLRTDIKINTN